MSADIQEPGAPPPPRRSGRSGEGGAPVSGALTIVLAVVAVVAGFLILRAITGGDDGGTTLPSGPGAATTAPETDETPLPPPTTEPAPPTTTEPPLVTEGAVVVVANANGINGSAGAMSEELGGAGFSMGSPTNATTGQLESTVIYYDPSNDAALPVAESVNRVLGDDSAISQVGTPAPVSGGELEGDVLVLLGNDKAGSSLAELTPQSGDESPTVTAPDVSGGEGDDGDAIDPDDDPDA